MRHNNLKRASRCPLGVKPNPSGCHLQPRVPAMPPPEWVAGTTCAARGDGGGGCFPLPTAAACGVCPRCGGVRVPPASVLSGGQRSPPRRLQWSGGAFVTVAANLRSWWPGIGCHRADPTSLVRRDVVRRATAPSRRCLPWWSVASPSLGHMPLLRTATPMVGEMAS
jgi:hypothetical protein